MFDAFIIDWIREEDARRRRESERPYLEEPPRDLEPPPDRDTDPQKPERGVVIIDRNEE